MKTRLLYITTIAAIIMFIISCIQTCTVRNLKKDVKRHRSNTEEALTLLKDKHASYELTAKEAVKVPYLDSLSKALGVKVSRMKQVDRIVYRTKKVFIHDTVLMTKVDTVRDYLLYNWTFNEGCFDMTGQVLDSLLIVDKAGYNEEVNILHYKKHKFKKLWFLNPVRWFQPKWDFEFESHSNCGDTKIERFNIIKR